MKTRWPITLVSILALLLILRAAGDTPSPNTLDNGYFSTSNYPEDNAPSNTTIVMTAETTDPKVKVIQFLWFASDGAVVRRSGRITVKERVSKWINETGSYTIYFAQDEYKPDLTGLLRIATIYLGHDETTLYRSNYKVAIRIESFNTIPEIPLLGIAGSLTAMLVGLALFKKRISGKQIFQ